MILISILSFTTFVIPKVKGQSLQATPNPAIGVLGGSVNITWTIKKIDQSDLVSNTRLFLGTNFIHSNLLYRGSVVLDKLEYAKRKFGGRIQAVFIEPNYTLTLRNLSFSDLITFILVVNQQIGSTLTPRPVTFKSVEINEVRGGPEFCLSDFPSIYLFDDNSLPRINITLCGVPQPEVQAKFTSRVLTVLSKQVNNYAHTYTLELPRLTQTTCGRELIVTAAGHSGTLTKKAKIFMENFVPAKVKIVDFFRNDDQIGCNNTRRVQWQPINTGRCSVEYTIMFRNRANDTIGTIKYIRDTFYCTSDYDRANSVIIWAAYKGTQGLKSEANFLTATLKPVPPTTTISPTKPQKENSGETQGSKTNNGNATTIIIVMFVLSVGLIATIVAFIMMRGKKNKGSNGKSKKRTYQGARRREIINQRSPISQEDYQGTSNYVSMHATLQVKYSNLPCTNSEDGVPKSSHYVNQQ